MNTIIFYDSKQYEKTFFMNKLSDKYKVLFVDKDLNSDHNLSEVEKNTQIISVFTGSRLNKDILKKFKKLKLILTRSVGYSHIDIEYCTKNKIIVANTPHYGDYTVAEFSFGILLCLLRQICFASSELKMGDMYPETVGTELYNKTIGIVGTGAIGSKSVKIASGFSMNILANDVNHNSELEDKYGVKYVDLDTLCKLSDIIFLHSPLTKKTYHLIDKDKIALMKENVVIVNTARGELIDTAALYNALLDNRIKGAALDVFEFEETISLERPINNLKLDNLRTSVINNKLLNLKNVLATGHVAYDTKEAVERILNMTLETLFQYEKNVEITNSVNK